MCETADPNPGTGCRARRGGRSVRRPVKTVFVDRDGVINVNRPDHVKSWAEFEFLPGALSGLASLTRHGFDVYVITNQAVVNRGLVSAAELDNIHDRMSRSVVVSGGRIAAVLFCPHRPDEECGCRKPAPGLLLEAADRFGVDLAASVLVGDHTSDLEAAERAGCRSILVRSGRLAADAAIELPAGCLAVLDDLVAAADYLAAGPTVPGGGGASDLVGAAGFALRRAPREAGA